jgi:ABC-2 type transport system permease protein
MGALFLQEWQFILKNKTIRSIMLVVPVLYFVLFGFLYSEKKVMDIPTVIVDADQTELSREMIRAVDHDQSFAVTGIVYSEQEAMQLIDRGEANVAFIIPKGMAENAKAGKPTEVLTIIDGSNMMISNTAVRSANTVIKSISAGVTLKKLEAKGEWGEDGKNFFTGIDFRYRVLYNPTFSYLSFMVFGLGGTVLQQTLFLGIALSVAREKEEETWQETLRSHGFLQLLIGKASPYLLVAMFNLVLTYTILLKGFDVPYYGNPLHLLLVGLLFNLAVVMIGFAISFFFGSQLQATQVAMMIAVPSFMLSGFTWPLMSMPPVIAGIGKSLPLTYYLQGVREILTKGHDLSYVSYDLAALAFMILLGAFGSFVAYHVQIRKTVSSANEGRIAEQA